MDNKISAQLQSTVVTEILTEIDQIKSKLPFLIDLDLEARKSILKYNTTRRAQFRILFHPPRYIFGDARAQLKVLT
ncbi:hypothetical protein L0128_14360 [candidate division KSB1 bacterium]|nr:hypothetical protein [candidate division KSB1 bacterium]